MIDWPIHRQDKKRLYQSFRLVFENEGSWQLVTTTTSSFFLSLWNVLLGTFTAHQITCTELGKAEEKVERYAKLLHMFCSLRYTVAYLWTHFVYFVNFHLKRKKIVHHLHNNQSFLGYGKHLNRGWKKIGNSAEM